MSNQDDTDFDDFDVALDDDVYDEALDASFEEDLDDFSDEELGLDTEESLDDFDSDDWDDFDSEDSEDNGMEAGAGAAKEKRSFVPDMSFNAMVITGAVVIGLFVLGYQLITKKPELSMNSFRSALNMSGAADGPVFGGEEVTSTELEDKSGSNSESGSGFLHNPEILEEMEMVVADAPPMPATITEEENAQDLAELSELQDSEILTPAPDRVEVKQIPRAPDDATPVEISKIDDSVELKANDFLKNESKPDAANNSNADLEIVAEAPEEVEVADVLEDTAVNDIKAPLPSKPVITPVQESTISVEPIKTVNNVDGAVADKLSMIIERLDDMEIQIKQIQATGDSRIEDLSKNLNSIKQELKSTNNVTSQPTTKKEVSVPKKAVKKKAAPRKAKAAPVQVAWELRAAQPGKAWVSKKGQKDMRSIVIGDNLSGVGRITAINFNGNRWSVQGTSGQILQ